MNILFYAPFSSRSRDTESLMEAFQKKGHTVFLLTQSPEGPYHAHCRSLGVKVFSRVLVKRHAAWYYLAHAFHLVRFCWRHRVNVLYAHLETAAFPAVLAQPLVSAKVIVCRHVVNEAVLSGNRNYMRMSRWVYGLARHVIVVSERARRYMIEQEGVDRRKIKFIPLAYNFNFYEKPNPIEVARIRQSLSCRLLVLTASRLVKAKRPELAMRVVAGLRRRGLDVKLMLLGAGPDEAALAKSCEENGWGDAVQFFGFRSNILDYLAACDLLIHPSLLDSSSVIVKEAGLLSKPVIACRGVGDLEEYLVDGNDIILVSPDNTEQEMLAAVEAFCLNPSRYEGLGAALHKKVLTRFSIDRVAVEYEPIHAGQSWAATAM